MSFKESTPLRAGNVLKGLLNGLEIKWKSRTYKMYTTNDGLDLCVVATSWNPQTLDTKEVGMRTHMTLDEFIKLVDSLSDEEYTLFAANMVLNGL